MARKPAPPAVSTLRRRMNAAFDAVAWLPVLSCRGMRDTRACARALEAPYERALDR